VAKFNKATHPGSKVVAANTLHFKPIFHQPLKKIVKGAPVPDEGYASKTCHSPAHVKIWGCSTS